MKEKVNIISALILITMAITLLFLPSFTTCNIKIIMIIIFSIYSLVNLTKFFLTKETKDYEGFQTFIASLVAFSMSILLDIKSSTQYLYFTLVIWIIIMSLIKLKKMDYFHDRHNKLWKIEGLNLILFILTGLLTCLNLGYSNNIQIIIINYFMLIHGILEIIIPIIKITK